MKALWDKRRGDRDTPAGMWCSQLQLLAAFLPRQGREKSPCTLLLTFYLRGNSTLTHRLSHQPGELSGVSTTARLAAGKLPYFLPLSHSHKAPYVTAKSHTAPPFSYQHHSITETHEAMDRFPASCNCGSFGALAPELC